MSFSSSGNHYSNHKEEQLNTSRFSFVKQWLFIGVVLLGVLQAKPAMAVLGDALIAKMIEEGTLTQYVNDNLQWDPLDNFDVDVMYGTPANNGNAAMAAAAAVVAGQMTAWHGMRVAQAAQAAAQAGLATSRLDRDRRIMWGGGAAALLIGTAMLHSDPRAGKVVFGTGFQLLRAGKSRFIPMSEGEWGPIASSALGIAGINGVSRLLAGVGTGNWASASSSLTMDLGILASNFVSDYVETFHPEYVLLATFVDQVVVNGLILGAVTPMTSDAYASIGVTDESYGRGLRGLNLTPTSDEPSYIPSDAPSYIPSYIPSDMPSYIPSSMPSGDMSMAPISSDEDIINNRYGAGSLNGVLFFGGIWGLNTAVGKGFLGGATATAGYYAKHYRRVAVYGILTAGSLIAAVVDQL